MKSEKGNNSNLLTIITMILITSLLFFGLGYLIHNSTITEVFYKTNYIKPGNASIIVYYYPSAGYNLYSLSIKGENLSLTLNYNFYQQTPNSIINPQSIQNIQSTTGANTNIISNNIIISNIISTNNVISTNIIPSIIPPSLTKYAAAFTELKPFSYYNITIRYTFAPVCKGICPEASTEFIMAGSESQIVETGANGTIVPVFFSNGPGIRQVISTANIMQNST
jgi:hypothetical protein